MFLIFYCKKKPKHIFFGRRGTPGVTRELPGSVGEFGGGARGPVWGPVVKFGPNKNHRSGRNCRTILASGIHWFFLHSREAICPKHTWGAQSHLPIGFFCAQETREPANFGGANKFLGLLKTIDFRGAEFGGTWHDLAELGDDAKPWKNLTFTRASPG